MKIHIQKNYSGRSNMRAFAAACLLMLTTSRNPVSQVPP